MRVVIKEDLKTRIRLIKFIQNRNEQCNKRIFMKNCFIYLFINQGKEKIY